MRTPMVENWNAPTRRISPLFADACRWGPWARPDDVDRTVRFPVSSHVDHSSTSCRTVALGLATGPDTSDSSSSASVSLFMRRLGSTWVIFSGLNQKVFEPDGHYQKIPPTAISLRTTQKPAPPICIAAGSECSMRRAVAESRSNYCSL